MCACARSSLSLQWFKIQDVSGRGGKKPKPTNKTNIECSWESWAASALRGDWAPLSAVRSRRARGSSALPPGAAFELLLLLLDQQEQLWTGLSPATKQKRAHNAHRWCGVLCVDTGSLYSGSDKCASVRSAFLLVSFEVIPREAIFNRGNHPAWKVHVERAALHAPAAVRIDAEVSAACIF